MALNHSPSIVTNGLTLALDAANPKSYPGSGNTLTDLIGTNITTTLVNGATANSLGITLDGVNDYSTISFNSIFNVTSNPFTVMVWNKTISPTTGYNGIITADTSGDSTWKIYKDNGVPNYNSRTGSTTLAFPAYTVGRFHCYAFTKNGTNLINYFDGVQTNSTSSATNPASFSNDLALGSYRLNDAINGSYLTNQTIGTILFYNRNLTADEVLQNFNALKGRYGL